MPLNPPYNASNPYAHNSTNRDSYKYAIRVETPLHMDAKVVILTRYRISFEGRPVASEVLTERGWWSFQPGEMLPSDLPRIDTLDLIRANEAHQFLMEWTAGLEERIIEALRKEKDTQL